MLLIDNPSSPAAPFTVAEPVEVSTTFRGKALPEEALRSFVFEQKVFPLEGGQLLLHLRKPLRLNIDPATLYFIVEDWGIKMDCKDLPKLPREVARRFNYLFSAADNKRLTEREEAQLQDILPYIDERRFLIDRSPPRYMEGQLCSNAKVTIVEWNDGAREQISSAASRALNEVNVGEHFSAHVRLGADNKVLSMERISILPSPAEGPVDDSWPQRL